MSEPLGKQAERQSRETRAELSPNELAAILAGKVAPDPRRVSVGRVFSIDLPAALRRWARKHQKAERETLRTDALLWIAERVALDPAERMAQLRPTRSRAVVAYIKTAERYSDTPTMPLRRDWLTRDAHGRQVLTEDAWRMLRTAVRVAEHRAGFARERAAGMAEVPTEGVALGQLAEQERRDAEPESITWPEDAAGMIAAALGVSENGARALIYDGYELTPDDAAEYWGIARASVASRVYEGRKDLAARYPEPRDLIAAIRDAAPAMREALRDAALLKLTDWRDGYASEADAAQAARDWRSEVAAMPAERRALLLAARDRGAGEELAERIALSVPRIMAAESQRAKLRATAAARGGQPLPAADASATPDPWNGAPLNAPSKAPMLTLDCSGQAYPAGIHPSAPKYAPDATVAGMPAYSRYHKERRTLDAREALAALDAH